MAAVTVTFDGTRVNQSQSNSGWGNWGSSGGAPSAEAPIAYQNGLAVNKKINSSSLGGIDYDPGSGAVNMTTATRRLMFAKIIVSDSFDLNTTEGVRLGIGSANNAYYYYNMAGSGANNPAYLAYPAQGGYILTAIDPNIAAWREGSSGSPSLTAIDWFGVQAAFITGQAKAENLALDAIDVGQGLALVGGDGGSTDAKFTDYPAFDQDITANRWGCCSGAGDLVNAWCRLRASGLTAFYDVTSIVTFKDGYHSRGLTGVYHDLNNAGATYTVGALLIGEGTRNGVDANDTRPDYVVTGTTMTADYNLIGQLRNFRDVTLNSKVIADGADIECHSLVLGGAEFKNGTFRPNSLSAVAANDEEVFGTSSGFHDLQVIQAGVGHAFEITGDVTLTNMKFSGFGANTTNDAALFINAASGAIAVSLVGSDQPTYRLPGGSTATVTFPQSNTLTISGGLNGGSLTIFDDETPGDADLETILQGPTATTGANVGYSHGYTSNDVVIQFYISGYEEINVPFTLTNAAQSLDLSTLLELEENL